MKNIISLFVILVLLLTTGCQKNSIDDNTSYNINIQTVDFEGIPTYNELSSSTYPSYDTLEEYISDFNLENHIIFKGKKIDNSTQFITHDNKAIHDWYCETPIIVIEPYYGNIKTGDTIMFKEFASVIEVNNDKYIICDEDVPPIKKETEYIFFLCKTQDNSHNNTTPLYSYVSMKYSINEISQEILTSNSIDEYFSKKNIDIKNLTGHANFTKDVFNKYYYNKEKLNLKIDVNAEVQKLLNFKITQYNTLIKNINQTENSSKDELLSSYKSHLNKYIHDLNCITQNEYNLQAIITNMENSDQELIANIIEQYGSL